MNADIGCNSPGLRKSHFSFELDGGQVSLPVNVLGDGYGFIEVEHAGLSDMPVLDRVVVHWINLPATLNTSWLCAEDTDGNWQEWTGRAEIDLDVWHITIDDRPDHVDAYREAEFGYLHLITHTMEVRRRDGAPFTGESISDTLSALQIGLSFALGRWVAPILPLGYGAGGQLMWSQWLPKHVDHPAKTSGQWWSSDRPEDLMGFLEVFMSHWQDPEEHESLRFAVMSAIAATESGFVEQRLMTSLAALEQLAWLTGEAKNEKTAYRRISRLLANAGIPMGIDEKQMSALATFARSCKYGRDGPDAITAVRHAITHPKDTGAIYRQKGLLVDASMLSTRYLALAILHRLEYPGNVVNTANRGRWHGDSDPVPWAGAFDRLTPGDDMQPL